MKRIALLLCGALLLVSNTAEARRNRRTNGGNYTQPVRVVPAATSTAPAATGTVSAEAAEPTPEGEVAQAAYSAAAAEATPAKPIAKQVSYSTSTAQGVANIMAASNRVGHWGGNRGCEGCGCASTPAAAYNVCCYSQSGMATVDVGYARSASGTWYCCRRYR